MGSLHIPISSEAGLEDLFSSIPAEPRAFIRRGFSVIAKLPESAYQKVFDAAVVAAREGGRKDEKELAAILGISTLEANSAVAALGMLSTITSSRKESVEGVVEAMVSGDMLSASDKSAVLRIVPKVREVAPEIRTAISKRMLMDAILPSFDVLELVLDMRLGDEEGLPFALPVAIAHLRTDVRDRSLWFQMTKTDVEALIKQLSALLNRLGEAEELARKLSPSAEGS